MRGLILLAMVGCNTGEVTSDEEAEMAWLGLHPAVGKAMNLGFDGFNAASSANIPEQQTTGDVSGTMTVNGQVDQGSSDNKGMRLDVALDEYSDVIDLDEDDEEEVVVTWWTDAEVGLPHLEMQLRDVPDGTLEGSFNGTFFMEGDLEGEVTLAITFSGLIEDDGAGGTQRVVGSSAVTGTATNDSDGVYEVDLTL